MNASNAGDAVDRAKIDEGINQTREFIKAKTVEFSEWNTPNTHTHQHTPINTHTDQHTHPQCTCMNMDICECLDVWVYV